MKKFENINIAIVEDEALIADHLALCIEDLGYKVSFIADCAADVFEGLIKKKTDLVLLDINLSGALDGIDIASQINQKYKTPFIFITSNTDVKTLERVTYTNPAGFIIKPYSEKDLETNIAIALFKSYNQDGRNMDSNNVFQNDFSSHNCFFIKERQAFIKVYISSVLYAEAMDNYTVLHTENGRYIISQTLKNIEQKLGEKNFCRCHRSFVVNISKIERIEPKAIFINGREIPLSDSYKQDILKKINVF